MFRLSIDAIISPLKVMRERLLKAYQYHTEQHSALYMEAMNHDHEADRAQKLMGNLDKLLDDINVKPPTA